MSLRRMQMGQVANYGLVSYLLRQPNNRSSNIKIKVASTHVSATYGNWATGTNYGINEIRAYPSNSPLLWKTVVAISGAPNNATPPSLSNTDWELDVALDMIQDSGDGVNYFRTTLQKNYDDFVRINNFQYGTYANAQFTLGDQNLEGNTLIGTSTSTIASNGGVPASKSFITQSGLSRLYDSVTLNASYSNSFAIPTVHPTLSSHNIGAGLSVAEGDTLTFYGDATNFFIFVVYDYNSSTGIATGFSTFHLGTGTYGTWTVKKEVFLYFKWQGGAVDFHGLLQTYNSGTGAGTVNNIFSASPAGGLPDWNISLAKRPPVVTAAADIYYGFGVGQPLAVWHFGEFQGTAAQHRHIASSAGTGWTYIYIDGPNIAAPPANVTIDTYDASGGTANQAQSVWSNLISGTHRYIAISCISPSGLSSNTVPWVYFSTSLAEIRSVRYLQDYDAFTPSVEIGLQDPQSAGELAWRFRLFANPGDTTYWFPFHGTITDRGDTKSFIVDGVTIDVNTLSGVVNPYLYSYQSFSTASCIQTGAITHPQDAGDFATYTATHTLNSSGISWDISTQWLKKTYIESGYNNMVSLGEVWFNKIKNVNGVYMSRPADNTSVNMANDFKNLTSYLFYSTSGSNPIKSLVLGQFWDYVTNWRGGLANAGTSFVQDFTGAAGAKFYPFSYSGYTVEIGDTIRVRGRMYLGWIENANSNL